MGQEIRPHSISTLDKIEFYIQLIQQIPHSNFLFQELYNTILLEEDNCAKQYLGKQTKSDEAASIDNPTQGTNKESKQIENIILIEEQLNHKLHLSILDINTNWYKKVDLIETIDNQERRMYEMTIIDDDIVSSYSYSIIKDFNQTKLHCIESFYAKQTKSFFQYFRNPN